MVYMLFHCRYYLRQSPTHDDHAGSGHTAHSRGGYDLKLVLTLIDCWDNHSGKALLQSSHPLALSSPYKACGLAIA